jgi:hypothetical protein
VDAGVAPGSVYRGSSCPRGCADAQEYLGRSAGYSTGFAQALCGERGWHSASSDEIAVYEVVPQSGYTVGSALGRRAWVG